MTLHDRDDAARADGRRRSRRVLVLLLVLAVALTGLSIAANLRASATRESALREAQRFVPPALEGLRTPSASAPAVRVVTGDTRFGAAGSSWWTRVRSGVVADVSVVDGSDDWAAEVEEQASSIPTGTSGFVVVVGDAERRDDPVLVARTLTRAVADARARAPRAQVLLVAPPGSTSDDRLGGVVRSAAALTGVAHLDLAADAPRGDVTTAAAADRLSAAIDDAVR